MPSTTSSLPVIAVIGSLNADLITYTTRLPGGGETLHGTSFKTGSGGKGGNQACACAKLSRHSTNLQNDLQSTGVDTSSVVVREEIETGVAIIIVEESSGENRILLNAGANYSLHSSQFQTLPEPKPDLVILQLEIPVESTIQILREARKANVEVLLNPAPAVKLPEEAYEGLDHLIMNETEVSISSGYSEQEIEDEKNLPAVAKTFHERGVRNVIITLGERGVFYSTLREGFGLVEAKKVTVVDTTAAGDTFVGAYALGVVKKDYSLRSAAERANAAAAKTIGKMGAQSSIPWADELAE